MSHARYLGLLFVGLGFGAPQAVAETNDWQLDVSAYMWFPKTETRMETPFGSVNSTLSASDAVDSLDTSVMLNASVRKGPWSFVGDLFYMDLSMRDPTTLSRVFSSVDTRITLTSLAGYGLYNVYEDNGWLVDAGMGLRMISSDIDVTLQGISRPDFDTRVKDTWVDPLLALRISKRFAERWQTVLWADAGGFDIDQSSKKAWQAIAVLSYRLGDSWVASAGYRHLHVDRQNDGVSYEMDLSGPLLGASYHF